MKMTLSPLFPPLPHPESGSKCCSPFLLCPGTGKLMQLSLSLPHLLLQTRDRLLLPIVCVVWEVNNVHVCVSQSRQLLIVLWTHLTKLSYSRETPRSCTHILYLSMSWFFCAMIRSLVSMTVFHFSAEPRRSPVLIRYSCDKGMPPLIIFGA